MIFKRKKKEQDPISPASQDTESPTSPPPHEVEEFDAEEEIDAVGEFGEIGGPEGLGESFDEVRVRPGKTVQLGDETVVFLPENGDPPTLLETQEAEILQRCAVFDSIENHSLQYCQDTLHDQSHRAYIEEVIEGFAERGLLMGRSELGERWSTTTPTKGMQITSFSSLTCDRVEATKRCFTSFSENFRRHGRNPDFTLVDNSHKAESRQGNQAWLRDLSKQSECDVFYCGPDEKEGFIRDLSGKGFPEHVLRFALLGDPEILFKTGANRNTQLLLFAGQPFFSADDDVICRISPSDRFQDRMNFFAGLEPTEFQFFARREDALDSFDAADIDLLAKHERLLGQDLRSLAQSEGGPSRLNLDNADSTVLRALEMDRGRVAVTSNGLVGDSGMGLTTYPLFLSYDNREALLSSDEDYDAFATARNVKRCAASYVLTSSNFFMATSCAFDLTGLLPPFFPVNRNSDGIFAHSLRAFDPFQFMGYVPYAIAHDPVSPRETSWKENLEGTIWPRASDVVNFCLWRSSGPSGVDEPRGTMIALGEHLRSLASLGPSAFGAFLRDSWANGVGANVSHLERLLTFYDHEPSHWAENVYELIDGYKSSLEKMGEPGSLQVAEGTSLSFDVSRLKDWIGRFGELMVYWPDLFEEAKRKRENGEQIAKKV